MDAVQFQKFVCLYNHFKNSPPKSIDMNYTARSKHSTIDDHLIQDIATGSCESAGCLVGHLPLVFPNEFKYTGPHGEQSVLTPNRFIFQISSIDGKLRAEECLEAFGLTFHQADRLFNCTYLSGEEAKEIVLEEMRKLAGHYGHQILV